MGVTVENYRPTTKPDVRQFKGKIRARFDRFWKLYQPVVNKYERNEPVSSKEFKAAYDDAMKGRDTFYAIAERSHEFQPIEMQNALALVYFHMDHMIDLARLMPAAGVDYKPKHAERGDKSPVVKGYQLFLKDWKFYRKKLDGDFGDSTYEAVKSFQKKNRMKQDGKIGPKTAAKIVEKAVADRYNPGTIQKVC